MNGQLFLVGSFLRLVDAISSSSDSDMDFTICFEAPFSDFLLLSPRFADNAAPAAICCFFDVAGMILCGFSTPFRTCGLRWMHLSTGRLQPDLS